MRTVADRLAEMQANPDDRRHGTRTGYAYGCRCDACREARSKEHARGKAPKAQGGPRPHPKDVCTVPEYLKPLMGRPSLDRADGRCVWCGAPATDRHHIVKRSQGRWVRNGVEVRKPTVRLCGHGNASGCHGKAHAGLLHFRWVQARPDVRRPLAEGGPGLPGHWEGIEVREPCDTLTAWSRARGWRRL